jgi:transcriptional regulator with XRE-family HTH domain
MREVAATMENRSRSPQVRRRRLGVELRQLRDEAGLTIEQLAALLEMSVSKVSRIETGQVGATPRDVRDIATVYGVRGQRLDNLMQLARETRERPWWGQYRDIEIHSKLAAYEGEASTILMFEMAKFPGLLQTRGYAHAIIRAVRTDLPPDAIERRVEFRMRRQVLLDQPEPPTLWAVIDEAVLHREVGGRETMREQLEHLIERAALPQVTLQVLPFSAGAHAGIDGPFILIRFPEKTDRDMVYLEHAGLEHSLDGDDAVALHMSLFDHLRAAALKPDDSLELLAERLQRLEAGR